MTNPKLPFWLPKERQVEIYGEALPRNYYGESRPPHYIYYKQMIEGELIKFSTGKTDRAEALKVAPAMLKQRLQKDKTPGNVRHVFSDHWPDFYKAKQKEVENGEIKQSTIKVIDRTKDKIMVFWKNLFLDKLDSKFDAKNVHCWEAQFDKYEEEFRNGNGSETMFNAVKYLNAYVNWMHKNGLVRRKVNFKDPRAKKERKKRKVEQSRILTIDEVKSLLGNSNFTQQVAIFLGFFMAFRISDVANLTWDRVNLDPEDPYIEFLGDDKEETYAKAPINKPIFEALIKLKQQSLGRWVFPQNRNPEKPLNTQTFYMERVFRNAGLEDFSFHILRHTRLTLDFGNPNIPDADVMVMRRVSLKVALEHYIHPNRDNRKRMVEQESSNLSAHVGFSGDVLKLYL